MFKAIKNFFTPSLEDDMVQDQTEAKIEEVAQEKRYYGITRWADQESSHAPASSDSWCESTRMEGNNYYYYYYDP